MAYKWHLDYVVDAKSEAMAYFYTQDANYYGAYSGTTGVKYIRDSYLAHIDYGFTTASGPFGTIPDTIVYTPAVRCVALSGCGSMESSTNAANYPDVPFDLICASGASCSTHAPSFFSTVRLSTITTKQYSVSTSSYSAVDLYTLTQTEPSTGDATSATLWLAQIQHKGEDFTAGGSSAEVSIPAVMFAGSSIANRVDTTSMPSMYRYRLTKITNETGGTIGVTYSAPVPCTAAWVQAQSAASAYQDTKSCYPVYWTPSGAGGQQLDWFEKYAVKQVLETDTTGGSLIKETDYSYLNPAWHYDDDESVKAKYRTYGQFRGYQSVTTMVGASSNNPQTKSTTTYYQGMDGDYLSSSTTRSVSLSDSQGAGHTDANALAGRVLESTGYLGDSTWIDHSAIDSYWVSAATATRTRAGLPALIANMTGIAEQWIRQRLSDGGATSAWRTNETDTTYDASTSDTNFGLPLYVYAHTVPVTAAYDRCTSEAYTPGNTTLNLVGLVALTEVDSVACSGFTEAAVSSAPSALNTLSAPSSSALTRPDVVVSATQTYYDGASSITATPSVGLATTQLVATGYSSGWVWRTKAVNTYDAYGRVLTSKDGNNNTTTTAYTLNAAYLTTAVSVTNALSQTSSKTLDPTRGLTRTSTDLNGVVTTDWYDALGRLVDEWDYSRATTAAANKIDTYTVSNTSISGMVAQTMNDEFGYAYTITIDDALGRVRQVQTSSAAGTGTRLISDTLYDSRGWVSKKNNAYADPNSAPIFALVSLADGIVANQDDYVYDGLGRVVYDKSEKYASIISTTTSVYNGDATTVIPPTGAVTKTTRTDPLGRTSEIDEYSAAPTLTTPSNTSTGIFYTSGGTAVPTKYGYDAHGNQATTTDASASHTWTSVYDLAGEVTSKSDPTAGTSTMTYDNDGNLAQSLDSRGDYVSYTYDALSRKTGQYAAAAASQVAYVSSSTPGNQSASWVYDNSNNAVASMTYPLGQLTTETSYTGGNAYTTQRTGYNIFGESMGEKSTIPSAEGSLAGTYTVTHTYSSTTGLLLLDTYASNGVLTSESVQHGYTGSLDLPDGLSGAGYGYAQYVTYDPWSRPLVEELGSATNGLASIVNTYDVHTGRLSDQLVKRATATPTNVDEIAYSYDLSGNTTQQTETRLGSSSDTETQCFRYDALDRLTSAWSATDACAVAPSTASHAMVANTLGTNSAYWTSWALFTQGSRNTQTQHAPTSGSDTVTTYSYSSTVNGELTATSATGGSTASSSYGYDTAGNTTSRTTTATGAQTLTWNNAGQLTQVANTTAGTNTNYVYDPDGNLLLQKDPTATVLYLPGQQITLTVATGVKTAIRYYALPGGGTVVRTGATTNYSFELTDQHGTANLYLDYTAQTPTWRQFDPYGNPRGTTATWPDNRTFLNKTTDTTTGLTAVGAREYDPATGRFISLDPVLENTDPEALPGYAYTDDNPITQTDPTGQRAMGDGSGSSCDWNGNCSGNAADSGSSPCLANPDAAECGNGGGGSTQHGGGTARYIQTGCLPISGASSICNNKIDVANSNTQVGLAFEWLLGIGNANQTFGAGDPLTQELAADGNVQALYRLIQQEIDSGKDQQGLRGAANYKDPGNAWQAANDLAGVFTNGRIGSNPADGYLGSYDLNYSLTPVDDSGKATLSIVVTNTSNYASFSHADRFLPSALSGPIDNGPDWLSRDVIDKAWGKRGPMATTTQAFTWSHTFYFDSCISSASIKCL
jgi:RHS repeat-associated protein